MCTILVPFVVWILLHGDMKKNNYQISNRFAFCLVALASLSGSLKCSYPALAIGPAEPAYLDIALISIDKFRVLVWPAAPAMLVKHSLSLGHRLEQPHM